VGRLVLLQDWGPTQEFLDQLRGALLLTGFATFAVTLTGGILFSRRVSQPFRDIAEAAGDLASGNWSRQVPIRGSAEAMTMAQSFNEMSSHLRHWHDQAEEREAKLQAAYERFRSVTESARDGIVSTRGDGTITFWNRSAGEIFGCDENAALGMALTSFIVKSDWPAYREALTSACGGTSQSGRTIDLTGVRKDGAHFPVELSLSASRVDAVPHVTAVIRDATERRRAEAQLQLREAELRQAQKLEAIGLLAGGVAHDFNNVLTAIVGYGELLIETFGSDDSRRHDVREILNASTRAAGLTRQLLAFSRRQVLQPRVLDLDAIVANTRKMLSRIIGEDITLSSATGPALWRVKADPGQIEQVLINLAVNARDAMRNGGTIHIALSNVELTSSPPQGLPPGRYVLLAVSDTGCGMSPEIAARIFEPFFTTKGEGKGTGLGLSMVYGIIQQSGGAIDVDSLPDRGTTFRIYLPQCTETEEQPSEDAAPRQLRRGSETVLLAEDDDHVRGLVAAMLRQQGYTVLDARDGEDALAIARNHAGPIELLLTDVVMPNMGGRALAEQLRTVRPSTRVLFMSGYSDDAILRAGIQAGGAIFIQKPFSRDTLASRIRDVIQGPIAVW
jgi:PAS domain S-box-containing protein